MSQTPLQRYSIMGDGNLRHVTDNPDGQWCKSSDVSAIERRLRALQRVAYERDGLQAELAELKRENAALRAREERVAVAFAKSWIRHVRHCDPIFADIHGAFAAFRQSEAWPE